MSDCKVDQGTCFHCPRVFMLNKCFVSKGKLLGFRFLKPNEDLVQKMTIGHPPQREENDSRTYHLP